MHDRVPDSRWMASEGRYAVITNTMPFLETWNQLQNIRQGEKKGYGVAVISQ